VGENVGEGVGEEEDDNTSISHSSVTSNRGGEMFNVPSPHKLTDDGVDPKPKTIPDGVSVRSKAGTCVPAVFVVTSFDGVAARPDVVDVFFCKATRRSTLERPTFFADEKSGGRVLSPAICLRVDALPRGVENCSEFLLCDFCCRGVPVSVILLRKLVELLELLVFTMVLAVTLLFRSGFCSVDVVASGEVESWKIITFCLGLSGVSR